MAKKIKLTQDDDVFKGKGKDEIVNARAGDDSVSGGGGNDTLKGGADNDVLKGGAGDDTLNGGADNDILLGGAGDDRLIGGKGNNTVDGGEGDDTIVISGNFADSKITKSIDGTGYVITAADGSATEVKNVELFQFADGTKTEDDIIPVDPSTGKSFTLTANTDAPGAIAPAVDTTGTAGKDTYNATAGLATSTLSASDQIDGGAETDTLKLVAEGSFSVLGANIKNVEKLSVTNVSGALATATIVGTNAFSMFENTSSVNNVAFAGVTTVGSLAVSNTTKNTAITFEDSAVAGAADSLALSLESVGSATVQSTITIDSVTAAGTGVDSLAITANGTAANNVLLSTNDTSIKSATISGAAALKIDVSDADLVGLATIDGSAATGALTINGIAANNTTVKGGTANDRFDFGANLTSADKVDGGAGTDTVAVSSATIDSAVAQAAIIAAIKGLTNIEVLEQTAAAAALEASAVTNINSFAFSGGTSWTVTGVEAGDTFSLLSDTTGAVSFAPALDSGADTLTLSATGADLTGGLSAASFETINLAVTNGPSADDVTLGTVTMSANGKITITGAGDVTLDTAALNAILDASALTGKANLTGGAGNNIITGGSANDILTGGAGIDTIDLAKGGTDIVRNAATVAADRDVVSGFGSGVGGDVLDILAGTYTIVPAGVDQITGANYKEYTGTAVAFTAGAGEDVIEFNFDAANNSANLANATDGSELLKALANQGSTVTLNGSAALDSGHLVAYDNGNAYIYTYADSADAGATIEASEINLVATLNGVAVGSLTHDNFA